MSHEHITELMTQEDYQALDDAHRTGGLDATRAVMKAIVAKYGLPWLEPEPRGDERGLA